MLKWIQYTVFRLRTDIQHLVHIFISGVVRLGHLNLSVVEVVGYFLRGEGSHRKTRILAGARKDEEDARNDREEVTNHF